ncbi:MAG: SDR family oxidoreductase [Actinomycetota bacterium]|nr:SDR family oxidoreductase [Actinomycetota bacterium]
MTARALVTGASSGIGETFARRLAARGNHLVVVARREDRLHALAAELASARIDVEVLPADLLTDEGLATVERRLAAPEQPVDLLVNNAGFGITGTFAESPLERDLAMVELNVVALVRLTRAGLVAMAERGSGAIVNLSSLAGFQAVPSTAVYAATKAFVTSFTEAVAEEARGSGVRLQALCPGLTRTEFHEVNAFDVGWLPDAAWQSAGQVVDASLNALESGRVVVVPGALNRMTAAMSWLTPRALRRRLVGVAVRR